MNQTHKIMLQVDLSNAENRVLFALSGDPRLQALARVPSYELDLHEENAKALFGKAAVTKAERHLGKVISHGAQRGMGGRKLSGSVLKMLSVALTERECDRFIERYMTTYPGVLAYFARVRSEVMRYRALANSWGRIIIWDYDTLEDGLYREAYSWTPQSEIAELMNRWGFVALTARLRAGEWPGAAINNTMHDSLVVSCWPLQAYDIALYLRASLERPRVYRGCALSVPLEFQLGCTLAMDREWKRLPSCHEFTETAYELAETR